MQFTEKYTYKALPRSEIALHAHTLKLTKVASDLPPEVEIETRLHIRWSPALRTYIFHHYRRGTPVRQLARDLNKFYACNLFTHNTIVNLISRYKIKQGWR